MAKEEKIGLAFGAVGFIVVLVFFLVLGNMSATPAVAPQAPSVPPPVIQPESSGLGLGDMLLSMGGVVLLVGFWVVANRFGWLSIEPVLDASEAPAELMVSEQGHSDDLPPLSEIYQEIKSLTLDLARREQEVQRLSLDLAAKDESLTTLREELAGQTAKVSELTRDMSRRHETIQRLSEERRQLAEQFEALAEKVTEREKELAAAPNKELSQEVQRLGEHSLFKEVQAEELSEFLLTVKLDGKAFMSKRRQDRLLSRMKVENMVIVRK